MKHLKESFFIVLSALLMVTLMCSSCKRDKCKRVACINGSCLDGICNCSEGYFGSDCGTVINAGYLGAWSATEECLAGSDHYTVTMLENGAALNSVKLTGFWGITDDTVAVVVAADGLNGNIARQSLRNVEVEGTWLSNDRQDEIDITFKVYNTGQASPFDQCTANLLKD